MAAVTATHDSSAVAPSHTPDTIARERAEATSIAPRITYISWAESCSRSDHTARELGGTSHMVYLPRFGSRPSTILFKYLGQWARTARILLRERPDIVFVMTPPVFAALPAFWYAWRHRKHVAIDAHSAAFMLPRWRYFQWLQRAFYRRAVTTLVHNDHLAQDVLAAGGHVTLVPDVPIVFDRRDEFRRSDALTIVAVCSFDRDEPVGAMFEAAARLPNARFYMTGNPRKLPPELLNRVPPNLTLTGFLETSAYAGLLSCADAVLALTTFDHTMLRAAYEAIYQGTPVIISDWPLLKREFASGAFHVDNTPEQITQAVESIGRDPAGARAGAKRMREQKLARWQATRGQLLGRLRDANVSRPASR
jgi:glycosyltransferase involved in cell wall biosynthesis